MIYNFLRMPFEHLLGLARPVLWQNSDTPGLGDAINDLPQTWAGQGSDENINVAFSHKAATYSLRTH